MKYKSKPIRSLKKILWRHFSLFIRRRDFKRGCISCGKHVGSIGQAQAGHYYSRGAAPQPSLYFSEKNVNLQCVTCNAFQEGNKQGYRMGLIRKYGDQIEDELLIIKKLSSKWSHFEYETMIKYYKEKNGN